MTATLFKYSISDSAPTSSPEFHEYVVKLPKNSNDPTLKPCIFFTDDGKMDTYQAHDHLALTYYPRSCLEYNLDNVELEDNTGKVITDAINKSNYRVSLRCWPSFGQQGGSREIIHVGSLPSSVPLKFKSLSDGGETDEFHQDNTANYDLNIAEEIAKKIISELRENQYSLENQKDDKTNATVGSFKTDGGLTINAKKKGGRFIAVSSGFFVYGSSMRIKLWAAVWKDNKSINTRYIYGPLEREMTFSVLNCVGYDQDNRIAVKSIFQECLKRHVGPYCNLSELIAEIIEKGAQVTDGFFAHRAKSYQLR